MLRVLKPDRVLHIEAIGLSDAARWDEYVRSRTESTVGHLHGWRSIVEGILGHEARYVAALTESGDITGVMPLVRIRNRVFGDQLVSMPFLSCGGPIGDPDAVEILVEHARELAVAAGVSSLELRSRTALPGMLETVAPRAVICELPSRRVRQDCFATRPGDRVSTETPEIEVRIDLDQIEPFYRLHARSIREAGYPVLPRSFFMRILHVFEDQVVFAGAYRDGEAVAAAAGLVHGSELEIGWTAVLRKYRGLSPEVALYSRIAAEMSTRGLERLRLTDYPIGTNARRVPSWLNAEEVPLPWVRLPATGRRPAGLHESAAFQVGTRIWRKLPLTVTNRIGPWLARYLP